MSQVLVRRDTPAWTLQVWVSFVLSIVLCAVGVWNLPSQNLDRAFVAQGFLFSLFTSLALAKMIRDNRDGQQDTSSWVGTCWAGFASALLMSGWGLFRMDLEYWAKGFVAITWLYLVSSSFVLAKTLRDKQEADLADGGAISRAQVALPADLE